MAVGAVQVRVVPELVVLEAASPVGTPGTAVQLVLPPEPPPPQDGRRTRAVETRQMRERSRVFFRCVAEKLKTNPTNVSPEIGSHSAKNWSFILDGFTLGFGFDFATTMRSVGPDIALWKSEDAATVVKVSVEVPPLAVTVMGLGLRLHVGASTPVTTGEMLHERVTVPVYPFAGVAVTVAVDEPPGLTDVGLAAPAESV
jgi:hypothetical protein